MCLLAGGFVKVQWFYKIINDVSSVTISKDNVFDN